jgi:hypothetical protein
MTLAHKSKVLFFSLLDKYFPFIYNTHSRKYTEVVMTEIERSASVVSPLETLKTIENIIAQKKRGAYMRFGDGDVNLATGRDDSFQRKGNRLQEEMIESFSLKGPGILKALVIHSEAFGYENEMSHGNHLVPDKKAIELLRQVYPFFVGHRIFSPVALHYISTYSPAIANNFLKLVKNETILFIGNENIRDENIRKLFNEVTHVKTPSENAYDKIDAIEKEAEGILKTQEKFGVVILAMGCSGRILMKRLYKKNYNIFLFDFGSLLDGICGNNSRTWLKKTKIDYEVLLKDL